MFKRKPKRRGDDKARRALDKVAARGEDERAATEAWAAGKQAEEEERPEDAIEAYLGCAAAWERHHEATGHPVPAAPYLRLGVLLRRAKDLEGEIHTLESYLACAGRDPDWRVQDRLQRVRDLASG